jgi:hypothetical protein
MRALLNQWNGHWEETLASYNAGASRVKQWLSWASYREPAEFVESIPITQTREYVQSVMRNAAVYREVYGPNPPDSGPEVEEEVPVVPTVKVAAPLHSRHAKGHIVARTAIRRKPPA